MGKLSTPLYEEIQSKDIDNNIKNMIDSIENDSQYSQQNEGDE